MFRTRIDEEIELELLHPRHAPALFALSDENREHLGPWMPWIDHTTCEADTEAFILGMLEGVVHGPFSVGIWLDGGLVGTAGFNRWNEDTSVCEIGYWLAASAQGRGVMTRVVRFLTRYAFETGGLNRVEIHMARENERSRAIPERLGFVHEGTLRQALPLRGVRHDREVFAMLAGDEAATAL